MRFRSLLSRIVLLHIVAVAIAAVFLPLVLFWLLTSEIENHGSVSDAAERIAGIGRGAHRIHLIAGPAEPLGQQLGQFDIVFDDQKTHAGSRRQCSAGASSIDQGSDEPGRDEAPSRAHDARPPRCMASPTE